jgi:alkylhydroperoxidase family enzyme
VAGLVDFESGPYSEKEKLGLRAADRLHRSPYELDDDFYRELKAAYSDEEIIELMATAAAFDFFPRFVDALRIPTTPLPETVARKG